MELVRSEYFADPDPARLTTAAVRGIASELDKYSVYYDENEWNERTLKDAGRYHGIGVSIGILGGRPGVLKLAAGGPADRGGLQVGDLLLAVDEWQVPEGAGLDEVQPHLEGPERSIVRLRVRNVVDERERRVEIERGTAPEETAYGALLDAVRGIGYLRVESFRENTPALVDRELRRLDLEGAASLILDLRGNRGGTLDAAVEISDRFLGAGPVVTTIGRHARQTRKSRTTADDVAMPMVVLVDGASASAAEVVAGALQDRLRAPIVGERTYGKGVVQRLIRLNAGGLKLTTAYYVTPAGRCLEGHLTLGGEPADAGGLLPDLVIPLPREEARRAALFVDRLRYEPHIRRLLGAGVHKLPEDYRDPQLAAAIALLTEGGADQPVPSGDEDPH
jgi:carboxyl-terminal processing protease